MSMATGARHVKHCSPTLGAHSAQNTWPRPAAVGFTKLFKQTRLRAPGAPPLRGQGAKVDQDNPSNCVAEHAVTAVFGRTEHASASLQLKSKPVAGVTVGHL